MSYSPTFAITSIIASAVALAILLFSVVQFLENNLQQIHMIILDFKLLFLPLASIPATQQYKGP